MPLNLTLEDLRGYALRTDHELRATGGDGNRGIELREGSWGGRAVRNLKIRLGEDRSTKQAGNREVKQAVWKALSAAYGPEIAKRAFVAGAGHLDQFRDVKSSSNHPLSGRHIEKMLEAAEREAAKGFVQELKDRLGTPNDAGGVSRPQRYDGQRDGEALRALLRDHVDREAARRGIAPEDAARALHRQLIPMLVFDSGTPQGLAIAVASELVRMAGGRNPQLEVPAKRIQLAEAEDRFRDLLRNPDNLDAPDDPAGRVVDALKRSFGEVDMDGRLKGWQDNEDGTRRAWEASTGLANVLQAHAREMREQDPERFEEFRHKLGVRLAKDTELPPALTERVTGALLAVSREGELADQARALAQRLGCQPEEVLRLVFGEAAEELAPDRQRAALREFATIMDLPTDKIRTQYGADIAFIKATGNENARQLSIAGEMRTLARREPPVDRATAAMLLQRLLIEAGLPPKLLPPDFDLRTLTRSALAGFPPAFDPER